MLILVNRNRLVRVYWVESGFGGSSILNLENRGFGPLDVRWSLLLMLLGIAGLLGLGRCSRLVGVVPNSVGAG